MNRRPAHYECAALPLCYISKYSFFQQTCSLRMSCSAIEPHQHIKFSLQSLSSPPRRFIYNRRPAHIRDEQWLTPPSLPLSHTSILSFLCNLAIAAASLNNNPTVTADKLYHKAGKNAIPFSEKSTLFFRRALCICHTILIR